jgi:DNA-directed RNA polymerase specialized sigma24 family protein
MITDTQLMTLSRVMFRLAYRETGDVELSKDMAQEAVTNYIEVSPKLDYPDAWPAAKSAAFNKLRRLFRDENVRRLREEGITPSPANHLFDGDPLPILEALEEVDEAVEQMKVLKVRHPKYFRAFQAVRIDAIAGEKAAALLGVKHQTVRTQVNRGRDLVFHHSPKRGIAREWKKSIREYVDRDTEEKSWPGGSDTSPEVREWMLFLNGGKNKRSQRNPHTFTGRGCFYIRAIELASGERVWKFGTSMNGVARRYMHEQTNRYRGLRDSAIWHDDFQVLRKMETWIKEATRPFQYEGPRFFAKTGTAEVRTADPRELVNVTSWLLSHGVSATWE